MDKEIARRKKICERAEDAEWEDAILLVRDLPGALKEFLKAHPPGLVGALWSHFERTRDQCGCTTAAHERPGCPAGLIERVLLDQDSL
jgi:hypothetical protein